MKLLNGVAGLLTPTPRSSAVIIFALVLVCSASPHATPNKRMSAGQPTADATTDWIRDGPRGNPQPDAPVRIDNVRLEDGPVIDTAPSTILKFDAFNASPKQLTDLLLEVAIMEKTGLEPALATGRMLVRPFKVRGHVVLEPGYTINYEMLLRNFSSDCNCVATVDVLSVRSLPASD